MDGADCSIFRRRPAGECPGRGGERPPIRPNSANSGGRRGARENYGGLSPPNIPSASGAIFARFAGSGFAAVRVRLARAAESGVGAGREFPECPDKGAERPAPHGATEKAFSASGGAQFAYSTAYPTAGRQASPRRPARPAMAGHSAYSEKSENPQPQAARPGAAESSAIGYNAPMKSNARIPQGIAAIILAGIAALAAKECQPVIRHIPSKVEKQIPDTQTTLTADEQRARREFLRRTFKNPYGVGAAADAARQTLQAE